MRLIAICRRSLAIRRPLRRAVRLLPIKPQAPAGDTNQGPGGTPATDQFQAGAAGQSIGSTGISQDPVPGSKREVNAQPQAPVDGSDPEALTSSSNRGGKLPDGVKAS